MSEIPTRLKQLDLIGDAITNAYFDGEAEDLSYTLTDNKLIITVDRKFYDQAVKERSNQND